MLSRDGDVGAWAILCRPRPAQYYPSLNIKRQSVVRICICVTEQHTIIAGLIFVYLTMLSVAQNN